MATKGTAWVLRRSTDLVPYLVAMAVREKWNTRHETDNTPDEEQPLAA